MAREKRSRAARNGESPSKAVAAKRARRSDKQSDVPSGSASSQLTSGESSRKASVEEPIAIDDDAANDSDIVIEDLPAQTARSATGASTSKAKSSSPLSKLDSSILKKTLPRSRNQILSLFTGALPPAGVDEAGMADGTECIGLEEQWKQLRSLIGNTLQGEGNSALLLGAPGTGKHLLIDSALRSFEKTGESKPYHLVRLDATLQTTDRLSLRELARQLVDSGAIRLPKEGQEGGIELDLEMDGAEEEDEENEGEEGDETMRPINGDHDGENDGENDEAEALQNAILSSLANTTSTILTLLSSKEAQASLPLVIVLSSFDLYTSRSRQALLYVLLDAVQAGSYTPGLCVLGTTSRLDTTDLLEKRVKSRFSGRTINVWNSLPWSEAIGRVFSSGLVQGEEAYNKAFKNESAEIGKDKKIMTALTNLENAGNDLRRLHTILYPIVASISIKRPSIRDALLQGCSQVDKAKRTILDELTTPEFALLIAAKQLLGKDRETFNFQMCFNEVTSFVKRIERDRMGASTAVGRGLGDGFADEAPFSSPAGASKRATASNVNIAWNGLLDRNRVMNAFRTLLSLELFQPESLLTSLTMPGGGAATSVAPSAAQRRLASQTTKTDFVRVRCTCFPQTIVDSAKSRLRAEPLNIHLQQWATSQSSE